MKTPIFRGSAVAIVTPFDENDNINYDVFGDLIEFQIKNSTDAIVVSGTTGESSTLSHEEHVEIIRFCVEKVNGRVPVIAGTGSNDTAYAIELSKEACSAGADALLVVTPYYNKTSQRGLVAHFTAIADVVSKPIILYSVASRTGVNITPETCFELSKHPMINGIKEASGNLSQIVKIASLCGDNLNIWSGNDDQITSICSVGGQGIISVLANIMPKQAHDIAASFLEGDAQKSRELQCKYLEISDAMFCDVNPIPVKAAMAMMGCNVGKCRMPLYTMTDANIEMVRKTMIKFGLIK